MSPRPASVRSIRLFGRWEVRHGSRRLERLKTRKAESLLAFLACHLDRAQPREVLLDMFWPDSPPDRARQSLSQALSAIRLSLESASSRPVLLANHRDVALDPTLIDCDVYAYRGLVDRVGRRPKTDELAQAVDLYRGDLMPGHYDDWVMEMRDHLQQLQLTCLESLADRARLAKQPEETARFARRALELDPLNESICRSLIEASLSLGQEMVAARVFQSFRDLLRRELGEELEEETQALGRRIAHRIGREVDHARRLAEPESAPPAATEPAPPAEAGSGERSGTGLGGRLPGYGTSFLGRDSEIDDLRRQLTGATGRIVVLTGLGGIGKTRLALEAAGRLLGSFRGGTFFLPLADAQTAEDLLRQIASAIGVDADELDLERLGAAVPTDSLLILDNFEQMEDRAALLLPKLLEACPSVNLLVTSRRCLGFAGEVVSAVEALATEGDPVSGAGPGGTDPDGSDPDGPAASSPAARLFRDRVERVRPDIEWTRSSVQLSATITRRLEGIPLAIELAAARCGILTVRQLSERLTKRLDLLKVTRPDIPERHAALRGAFDWSFRLLPRDVQKFLVDLSVFRGSWTVDAAEDVCDAPLALDWMELLCDCSLLIRAEAADEIRFRFFDVVREYLTERMTPTRLERLLGRKLRYLARVVDRDRQAIHGGSRARLVAWFQAELDNVRHVLTWSEHRLTSSSRDLPTLRVRVLGMCGQLGNFWRFAALHAEGAEWNRRLLEAAAGAPSDPSRTAARWTRGYLLLVAGREAEAARMLEEVLEDQRRTRNLAGQADSLLMLGHIHLRGGDSTAARTCLEEALAIFRRLEQGHGIGAALSGLADVLARAGETRAARERLAEALAQRKENGEPWEIASCYNSLGLLDLASGAPAEARASFERALVLRRDLGDELAVGTTLYNLTATALRAGWIDAGLGYARESLEIHLRLAAQSAVAHDLAHIAQLMAAAARWRDAAFVRFLARRFQERDAVAFEPGAETGLADLESRLAEALSETERLRCRASALALSRDELAEAVLPLLVSESPRTPDQGSTGKM